ncbi:hypothetical protein J7554_08590 [Wohlfahrtiimonas chitiniclastica]|uniref:hypothetical protein n=1 Tax=Wohlfahrtiimonas chitiniclastica TaxID=400946 RepID=UPI001BCBB221|nr:hypothetical protein [Wohlfahrtiimonas chitiniclastica]MBS7829183.1 hypothetical protein [Wohlfahrtiimonas chitiniclastica]
MKELSINIDEHLTKIKNDSYKMISKPRKSFHDHDIGIIYLQSIDEQFQETNLEALKEALIKIEHKYYSCLNCGSLEFNKMGIASDDYYHVVKWLDYNHVDFQEKSLGSDLIITRS